MIGTPVQGIIRAIPMGAGYANSQVEQYFELTGLPWADQQDIRKELGKLGFYVQDIYLSDPMPIQVGLEIRNRLAAEQENTK
jgi:hypothetical protein